MDIFVGTLHNRHSLSLTPKVTVYTSREGEAGRVSRLLCPISMKQQKPTIWSRCERWIAAPQLRDCPMLTCMVPLTLEYVSLHGDGLTTRALRCRRTVPACPIGLLLTR